MFRTITVVVALVAAALVGPAGAAGQEDSDPAGVGDPYFPTLGNGGYDVRHYTLDLGYDPATDVLTGSATIEARATERLEEFHLDLRGLEVSSVTVGDTAAEFSREDAELVITPERPVQKGKGFTTVVEYSGIPEAPIFAGELTGWVATPEGAHVYAQPDGARSWFPANDHPTDDATFTFRITVPDPFVAVANGLDAGREPDAGNTTYVWKATDPMPPYLAVVAVGDLVIDETDGPKGLPIRNAYARGLAAEGRSSTADTSEMIEFFSDRFGPYPFRVYGSLIVYGPLGALETQTLSLHGPASVAVPELRAVVFAHELAHQWFGDSVRLASWRDMWLNEGFATYSEWLWVEHDDDVPLDQSARSAYDEMQAVGGPPPGDPGAGSIFDLSVYYRGALTLYALRADVGERDFDEILRTYYRRFSGETVTTEDFVAVAEKVSGKELDPLFDVWLYQPTLPPFPVTDGS